MADVTVAQFAEVLKVPVDKLLTQLDEAGIKVAGSDDTISEDAKLELLTHLAAESRPSSNQRGLGQWRTASYYAETQVAVGAQALRCAGAFANRKRRGTP